MLLLCIFKQFFFVSREDIKRVSVKRGTTMCLDGFPKAKAVYEQSSKILFKQKWGIPQVYSFSPFAFLAGPNLLPLKVRNIAS